MYYLQYVAKLVWFGFGPLAMEKNGNVRATILFQTTAAAERNGNSLGKASWFNFMCQYAAMTSSASNMTIALLLILVADLTDDLVAVWDKIPAVRLQNLAENLSREVDALTEEY